MILEKRNLKIVSRDRFFGKLDEKDFWLCYDSTNMGISTGQRRPESYKAFCLILNSFILEFINREEHPYQLIQIYVR